MAPGHPDYGRVRLALLLVGVATLGLMYAPQPLLPVISEQYALSAAHASWLMSAVTLGVAFEVQRVERAAADPHDRQLDSYATEEKIYRGTDKFEL